MDDNKDFILNTEDLIKTNQRLNEQIKSLIIKNDELSQAVNELEKQLVSITKDGDESIIKVKGITVLFIQIIPRSSAAGSD